MAFARSVSIQAKAAKRLMILTLPPSFREKGKGQTEKCMREADLFIAKQEIRQK